MTKKYNNKEASGCKDNGVNLSTKHLPRSTSDMTTKSFYIKTFG